MIFTVFSMLLVTVQLLAFNSRVSAFLFTTCQRLRNGNIEIEAIGYYGGAEGTDRFLVITGDKTVWDQSGSAFDPLQKVVTLQELAGDNLNKEKWHHLKENMNDLGLNRKAAIIRTYNGEEDYVDWLFFTSIEGRKCYRMNLEGQVDENEKTSCYVDKKLVDGYQLVSAAPIGLLYVFGYQSWKLLWDDWKFKNSPLCLSTIKLNNEEDGFPSNLKLIKSVPNKWIWTLNNKTHVACFEDTKYNTFKNYRFFMDKNKYLYAVDNDAKQVISISIKGTYLHVLHTYNFYDFFDCGYKWVALIIIFVLILVGLIAGGYFWYYKKDAENEQINMLQQQQQQQQQIESADIQMAKMEALKLAKPQSSIAGQAMSTPSLTTPSGKASISLTPTKIDTLTPLPKSQLSSKTVRSKIKSKIPSAMVSTGTQSDGPTPLPFDKP